jgi:putative ABC transport system permease protein
MLRVTLRSLLARKLRLALSALAVVLGVSFVSGTLVLTDTLGRVFDRLFTTVNAGTALSVRAESLLAGDEVSDRRPVPEDVLAVVREVDGVAEAVGKVTGLAQVVSPDGTVVSSPGAPTLGGDFQPGSRAEQLVVRRGTAPSTDDQVVLDVRTAERTGIEPGDRVTVLLPGSPGSFTVSGLVALPGTDELAGASLVGFRLPVAQRLLGTPGAFTEILVAAEPGVASEELRRRVAAVLPDGFEAVTRDELVADSTADVREGLRFFTTVLLVFAAIALFVGAFLIANTFSMLVAQRTRELAVLRALGASRGQVMRSVLVEALVIGSLASVVGFALGLAVAVGLRRLLATLGLDLPAGATVVQPTTLLACLAVGIGVTTLAALLPARRAAHLAPVQAMRDAAPAEERALLRRGTGSLVLLVAGLVPLGIGLARGRLPAVGIGVALTFLAVAALSPLVVRPVAGALGAASARLGVPGRLGRDNAVRSPRRTSATASALMVGLALVSAVSVVADSVKASVGVVVERSLGADFLVRSGAGYRPLSAEVEAALRDQPGVAAVAALRSAEVRLGAERAWLQGADPAALQEVLRLTVVDGDLEALSRGAVALDEEEAEARGLSVGDRVALTWSRTGRQEATVGAVYAANEFAGEVLVSDEVFVANTVARGVDLVAATIEPGTTPRAARRAVERALAPYPDVVVEDRAEFVATQRERLDELLNAVTVLLVLSVVIALLGIVNTLALSVAERTRELGLLRAVGMSRRQVRRMIRIESVVIALYGALLGLVVGAALGAALVRALRPEGITEFSLPVGRLLAVVVVAALAGVAAAALPARRAARLDVLKAVAAS